MLLALAIIESVTSGSPKRSWESATVILTIASAILALFGLVFSFWEEKRKYFKLLDRVFSILGGVIGVMAALALMRFTHFNRIEESKTETQIRQFADEASKAVGAATIATQRLNEEQKTLSETQQELSTTSVSATSNINRLNRALANADNLSSLQELIILMNADDAAAYDQLKRMKQFTDRTQENMVEVAIQNVIDSHNTINYRGTSIPFYKWSVSPKEAVPMLDANEASVRKNALIAIMNGRFPSVMPKLVYLATSDPSLDVRSLAAQVINIWTLDHFTALDTQSIQNWWNSEGKKEFPSH